MTQAPKVKKKKKKRKTGKCQDCFCLAKQFVILLFFLTEATRTIFFYWQSNQRKPKEKKKKKNPKKHLQTILHQQNTDILLVLQRLPTKFQFQVGYIISKNQSCKMSNSLKTAKWLLET